MGLPCILSLESPLYITHSNRILNLAFLDDQVNIIMLKSDYICIAIVAMYIKWS